MEIRRQEAYRHYEQGLTLARNSHPELAERELDAFALAYTAACLGAETCFMLDDSGLPIVREGQVAMRIH
jgi:hypothetical protein